MNLEEKIDIIENGDGLEPTNDDSRKMVGIELECIIPDQIAILKELAKANLYKYIRLGNDYSITTWGYGTPAELKILASQREFKSIINKVCSILLKHKVKVNDTCGLHVHLDMRNRNPKLAFRRLVNKLPLLSKMVNKERLNNTYCILNTCNDLSIIKGDYKDGSKKQAMFEELPDYETDRYVAINPQSLYVYNTIECRLHESTLDSDKIINWVQTLVKITDCRKVG